MRTTIKTSHNLYIYRPLDLYIAYGVSIACAVVCVGLGCAALYRNGLSYSSDFSTILRTTQREELHALIAPVDTAGGDPLPLHIARAVVTYEARAQDVNGAVHGFRFQRGKSEEATNESLPREGARSMMEHSLGGQDILKRGYISFERTPLIQNSPLYSPPTTNMEAEPRLSIVTSPLGRESAQPPTEEEAEEGAEEEALAEAAEEGPKGEPAEEPAGR